jgi:hypothetical protein
LSTILHIERNNKHLKIEIARLQQLTPVILATQEAEMRRIPF